MLSAPGATVADVGSGAGWSSIALAKAYPGATVHDYGKSERPGRKLGHVTVFSPARVRAWRKARVMR